MTFNSLNFLLFSLVVFPLYWCSGHRFQNKMLLVASLFFYGCWGWRFLIPLLLTVIVDFTCGQKIAGSSSHSEKRFYLGLSIAVNLGMLGFFKYSNFFQGNVIHLLSLTGLHLEPLFLQIALPIGISFYTFQSMSYVIDVYRGDTPPARSLADFAVSVCYFPHLVAGPIQRSANLLKQLQQPRHVSREQLHEGFWLIVWGLYKKAYVADHLAKIVQTTFLKSGGWTGSEVLFALYAFAFQIYGDFSGYSDMARGLAKLMGIDLMINFGMPYGVKSLREFWRHWHISLSQWLRDYVYIPLGGSRCGKARNCINLILTLLIGGLWHGAGWTFIVWGGYHGILLASERAWRIHRRGKEPASTESKWMAMLQVVMTFHAVCLGWLFFRAGSLHQACDMLQTLIFHFGRPDLHTLFYLVCALWFLLIIAFLAKPFEGGLVVFRWPWPLRGLVYFLTVYSIIIFGAFDGRQFIYFQF